MNAEIIAIGSELLLGQVLDTNSFFLAKALNQAGINLYYKTTVGDNRERLKAVLNLALKRSQIIITSGGLGPTEDDITREVVAQVAGRPLVFDEKLWEKIEDRSKRLGITLSDSNRKQAQIPQGSIPMENPIGSAPGFITRLSDRAIFSMPGVPRELQRMTDESVIPYIRREFNLTGVILSLTLKVAGATEARVGELVADLMRTGNNPTLGTLVDGRSVNLRITARADTEAQARRMMGDLEGIVRGRLGNLIFGTDEETLEGVVGNLLKGLRLKLGIVEMETGGLVMHRLVAAGFDGEVQGLVLPNEEALKRFFPGVAPDARALAQAVRELTGCHLGLSVVSGMALCDPEGLRSYDISHPAFGRTSELGWQRVSSFVLDNLRLYLLERSKCGVA